MEVEDANNMEGCSGKWKPPEKINRKATFKEKVLGVSSEGEKKVVVNLLQEGMMTMELIDGNKLFPKFDIELTAYSKICKPWEDCLVVKLLGKHICYGALCAKLKYLWNPVGGYEVRDVHHGYFLVKFNLEADKEKVMSGAPWLIYDHYLSIKPWTPDFVSANSQISTTLVWIRIPGLGFQFYDESILLTLATAVGLPIKVDMNTVDMRRGRFARICVEIDLNKPVVGKFCLRGIWYNIEYEGLHLLCSACGCYSHIVRSCTKSVGKSPDVVVVPDCEVAASMAQEETGLADASDTGCNESQQSLLV